jgi:hypothetical protein
MKTMRTHRTLNKIRATLIGTALVAAASYVSPVDAAMIFGAIGDDGSGPPGAFDGSITAIANSFEGGGGRLPEYAIDGTGIAVSGGGDPTDRNDYQNDAGIDDNGDLWNYLSGDGDITGWFKVDLGQIYPLADAFYFNFNPQSTSGNESRGLATADIYYAATDPGNNTPGSGSFNNSGWTLLESAKSFAIAPADNNPQTTPDVINFGGVNAQFVALDFLTNHGHSSFTGIGEIQFFAVPEPSTFALLGLFGVLLLRVRRDR